MTDDDKPISEGHHLLDHDSVLVAIMHDDRFHSRVDIDQLEPEILVAP
ncbi:hypothetical protein [Arthrobacter sp. A5]